MFLGKGVLFSFEVLLLSIVDLLYLRLTKITRYHFRNDKFSN